MKDKSIWGIIFLCITINHRATEIYLKLSKAEKNNVLKTFWSEMAEEEIIHAAFWKIVEKAAKGNRLPDVFDDPAATREELCVLLEKIEILLRRWEEDKNRINALILAYRLEYYMLHPAFELLYKTLNPCAGETESVNTFDKHIQRFIKMFIQYGSITPELELLGETLQSLWHRNRALTRLAMMDSLTGLFNRRGFFILAKELFYLAHRTKENIGVLMIDIDHFKAVNDSHGHPKGDAVLRRIGQSLEFDVRKSDIVGRFGGEEFIILFPSIATAALPQIAEKIRSRIQRLHPANIPITVSIGMYQGIVSSDPDIALSHWISKADEFLYNAKTSGRNCVLPKLKSQIVR